MSLISLSYSSTERRIKGNMAAERGRIDGGNVGRHVRGGDTVTLWCLSIEV